MLYLTPESVDLAGNKPFDIGPILLFHNNHFTLFLKLPPYIDFLATGN
jgi:hypothetical protein